MREKQELDEVWADPSNHLHVAPGEEILEAMFSKLGSAYHKTTDAARIAKEMLPDEIDQEIIKVIEKARALVSK